MNTLSADQLKALQNFARSRGRTWKSKLGHAWETGAYGFADDSMNLQTVRNQFGPSFLQRLRLPGV